MINPWAAFAIAGQPAEPNWLNFWSKFVFYSRATPGTSASYNNKNKIKIIYIPYHIRLSPSFNAKTRKT